MIHWYFRYIMCILLLRFVSKVTPWRLLQVLNIIYLWEADQNFFLCVKKWLLTFSSFFLNRIHQYEEILPCLLRLLNKIWTLEDWISKYLHHGSALTCLFSDGQFLKMVYYLVRFCEVELKRSRTEVFTAVKSCELYIVTLLPLILPLLLEVNVHQNI